METAVGSPDKGMPEATLEQFGHMGRRAELLHVFPGALEFGIVHDPFLAYTALLPGPWTFRGVIKRHPTDGAGESDNAGLFCHISFKLVTTDTK